VNDMPTGKRERAPPNAICRSESIICVDASRSSWRDGSVTTSIAISFEIDAIGRTASGFFV